MASPEEWFKSLPVITKTYLVSVVVTTCLISFGMVSPMLLYFDFKLVLYKFQIWRFLTCFLFFGKFSMKWMFQIFIMVRYFTLLENDYYQGPQGTADFTFLCAFGMICMLVIAHFWSLPFLGPPFVFMTLYVWSRKQPHRQISFWGFALQAWHLPFVLLVFGIVMGSSPVLDIVGITIGHLWHFLKDIVPHVYQVTLLKTPQFIYKLYEPQANHPTGYQAFRGGGNRLG